LHTGTSRESSGHVHRSRSLNQGQGQGHVVISYGRTGNTEIYSSRTAEKCL